MTPAETPHEPDEMGVWSDGCDIVWLPRTLYPKRIDAIRWCMDEWGLTLPEVRCVVRWLRYEPRTVGDHDGGEGWQKDRWQECEKDDPGAFPAWRLESA